MKIWKSLALLFVFIFIAATAAGGNVEKQYKKLIQTYDVSDEVKDVESGNPVLFWSELINSNELLMKFGRDMKKNRGAEKEAVEREAQLPKFYPQYDHSIVREMQGFCDTLLIDAGIADIGLNCSLHLVASDEVNAFTALTDDGFAMCITTGLLSRKGMNYDILMGFVAHEFVHGALKHHIRGIYAEAKKRRKDELLGGIVMGLNGLALGLEAYSAAAYGAPVSGTNYGSIMDEIKYEVKTSTLKYSFKYSREQEYEADLIAFRFLQNLGREEEFINGLKILGSIYDSLYSDYSDHPTIASRIEFLKFVRQNPDLGNTKNAKLKKTRTKKESNINLP